MALIGKWFAKYWYLFIILASVVGVWFFKTGYIFGRDISWGPNIRIDFITPYDLIMQLFFWVGLITGQQLAQKIMLSTSLFIAALAGYRIGGNAVATFVIFNPFVYERLVAGQFNVLYAYSFFLWIVYIFRKNLLSSNFEKKDIYKISMLYSLSILSMPHSIFLVGSFLLVMGLIFYKKIISDTFKGKTNFKKLWQIFLIFLIPFISLNFLWLKHIFLEKESVRSSLDYITELDFKAFETMGSGFIERAWNIFNLQGFWVERFRDYFIIKENFLRSAPAVVIWSISLAGLYFLKKQNKKVFYILVSSIFILFILAQATSIPFIKNILYSIPFYSGLREPQKWVMILVGIIAFSLAALIDNMKESKVYVSVAICITSFLWTPFLLFGAWGQLEVTNYPSYYKDINDNLNKNNCYEGTTIVMPWHMYVRYHWLKVGSFNPAHNYFDCPVITGTNVEYGGIYDNSYSYVGRKISDYVLSKGNEPLPENISTIILFKDLDYVKYKFLDKYSIIEDNNNYTLYKFDK